MSTPPPELSLPIPFEYDKSLTCLISDANTKIVTPAVNLDNLRDFGEQIGARRTQAALAFSTVVQSMRPNLGVSASKDRTSYLVLGSQVDKETGAVIKRRDAGIIVATFPAFMERILDSERPIDRLGQGTLEFYKNFEKQLLLKKDRA